MKKKFLLSLLLSSILISSCVQLTPEQLAFRQSEYELGVQQMNQNNAKPDLFLPHLHNAADLYLPEAQFLLGQVYSDGRYLVPNWYEAVRWYERAGYNGILPAQQILANVYHYGRPGVPYSYTSAISWYKRAGRNGDANAAATAGFLILETAISDYDFKDAYYWLERAGREGNFQARIAARELGERIHRQEERERRQREREERIRREERERAHAEEERRRKKEEAKKPKPSGGAAKPSPSPRPSKPTTKPAQEEGKPKPSPKPKS